MTMSLRSKGPTKKLVWDKRSSLFSSSVSDEQKSFKIEFLSQTGFMAGLINDNVTQK